jgi:SpoVK/Ycf46/Vps4 family AAA+-type ATPase
MMNITQCLEANRPLLFIVAESDVEVLKYLSVTCKEATLNVYSSTLADSVPLTNLLGQCFNITVAKAKSALDVLHEILTRQFDQSNNKFEKYVFLDCQHLVSDPQQVRKIKDILSRYQLDTDFSVNMIMISQTVCVPMALERLAEVVFFDLPNEAELRQLSDHPRIEKKETSGEIKVMEPGGLYQRLERDPNALFQKVDRYIGGRNRDELNDALEATYFEQVCKKADLDFENSSSKELKEKEETLKTTLESEKEEILNNLRGLTLFEVEQAFLQSFAIHRSINLNFIRDFKKSAIAKTDLLSLLETGTTFDDIGGMQNLKKWIKKSAGGWTVEGKKYGLPLLKGLLMVGLPGTGKSLICKAIGNEWGLPVVSFDPSRIFSSRVGDSESNMHRVLQIIENMAPAIMFIDEIEKGLAGMQSSTFSDSGVTARVIGSFLIWMQENNKPVFVVATANNIQYLPPELISRFDETFFVNLPQDFERQEIFKIHIKKLNRDPSKFDLKKLADMSKDLSGRELEQVLRESMYDAYHAGEELDTEVILNVLTKKTNLLTSMAEQLKYLLKWVGYDETKNDGIRARYASTPNSIDINRVQTEIDSMLKDIENKKPFE